jgi:hypothetical protein
MGRFHTHSCLMRFPHYRLPRVNEFAVNIGTKKTGSVLTEPRETRKHHASVQAHKTLPQFRNLALLY